MKKTFKKLTTSFLSLAMVLSSMTLFTVPALAEEEAVAYLSFADEAWGAQYWMDGNDYAPVIATSQAVTGYGQYTVSLDLTAVEAGFAAGIAFLDVEVSNGESLYPNSYMTIDSLMINDEEVAISKTYTSSDDGIATRTNLYNEWVADIPEGRTMDGDDTDLTAIVFDKTTYPEVKTVEVTFTLGDGVPFGTPAAVEVKELPAEGTTAFVSMADNSWAYQYWFDGNDYAPVVATNATVTGYGQYSASLDFTGVDGGVCPDIVFMDIEVKDGELYFPNSYMQIDSVKINGEAVEVGATFTNSDNGTDTRTNLFNQWVEEVTEGRTNGLDLSEVTAIPIDGAAYTNVESVEVTFTLVEGEAVAVEEVEVAYVMPTEFNAFMMFSDVSEAWQSYAPGSAGDTSVIGDGKYTVYLKASDIGATGQATEGQVFLIDIEGLGRAMVELGTLREAEDETLTDTDVVVTAEVYVDGEKVNSKNKNIIVGDLEGNDRLRLELYNTWGSGTVDNPVVMPNFLTPEDEIKVIFTLVGTGLNTGAIIEDEAAADTTVVDEAVDTTKQLDAETTSAEPEDSGLSTGIIVTIIVVAVAVIGGTVYMIMKKKK